MLTEFGKELRKIRLDRDELLRDMAKKLGVTVSYLSAVENGNRKIPDAWIYEIAELYELEDAEVLKLQELAYRESQDMAINISNASMDQKNLAFSFARRFQSLNESEVADLQNFFDRRARNE